MGKGKYLGIGTCIIGSILAILFVPTEILGTNAGWHFILKCETNYGGSICAYQIINTATLLLELVLINGIGIALYYFGTREEKAVQ